MLHELTERFGYRYRRWIAERQGDVVGAGMAPPAISPKTEPMRGMVLRFLWRMVWGFLLLSLLHRIAADGFPMAVRPITIAVMIVGVIWFAVGLFVIAGEALAKRADTDGDKSI